VDSPSSEPARTKAPPPRWSRLGLPSPGLGVKMAVLAIAVVLLFVGLFGYFGTTALDESQKANLQDRVVLAENTARHVDYVLASIQDVLTNPESRACWLSWEQATTSVECAYHRLQFFATQAILVDRTGRMVAAHPPMTTTVSFTDYASVAAVLEGQPFAVSRFGRPLNTERTAALAAAPVFDASGNRMGALVIAIDLAGPGIRTFSNSLDLGQTGYMDLVDLGGRVLASTRSTRVGQTSDHGAAITGMIQGHREAVSACHDCHDPLASSPPPPTREILAFAPLEMAPWGIAVRQNEDEALASTRAMQQRLLILLVGAVVSALVLVYFSTRSVLRPIQSLTAATRQIAAGDLETPIRFQARDELGVLARSFDEMRVQLRNSIAEIRGWNVELDTRVQERTTQCRAAAEEIGVLYEELREKEEMRKGLLHRILSVQEDERKRISRELHDETCQVLLTLALGLENVGEMVSEQVPATEISTQLERLRSLAKTGRDEVNRLIFDLRPMMLDHLGLVSALRWYAEVRLGSSDIQFTTHEIGTTRRLPPALETTLFRVGQEAINNIAQHSRARHADMTFTYSDDRVAISIIDDGTGFVPASVADPKTKRGLGLMGMEERVSSLGGEFDLQSTPETGTRIRLSVPINGKSPL
jgi:signal transduction histidine kinase